MTYLGGGRGTGVSSLPDHPSPPPLCPLCVVWFGPFPFRLCFFIANKRIQSHMRGVPKPTLFFERRTSWRPRNEHNAGSVLQAKRASRDRRVWNLSFPFLGFSLPGHHICLGNPPFLIQGFYLVFPTKGEMGYHKWRSPGVAIQLHS